MYKCLLLNHQVFKTLKCHYVCTFHFVELKYLFLPKRETFLHVLICYRCYLTACTCSDKMHWKNRYRNCCNRQKNQFVPEQVQKQIRAFCTWNDLKGKRVVLHHQSLVCLSVPVHLCTQSSINTKSSLRYSTTDFPTVKIDLMPLVMKSHTNYEGCSGLRTDNRKLKPRMLIEDLKLFW